ncbi:MAG: hypothetical protein KatS3mg031_2407 [Chitinophagales bacterium]|nr:MAG: hypothetical protein KatS3mg031_2407 [Chitinophagales bacterium]
MERNFTINVVFIALCLLLMGFVYLNNKIAEAAVKEKMSHEGQRVEVLNH